MFADELSLGEALIQFRPNSETLSNRLLNVSLLGLNYHKEVSLDKFKFTNGREISDSLGCCELRLNSFIQLRLNSFIQLKMIKFN